MNIHKAGLLCLATIDILIVSSSSHPEVSREKGRLLLSENVQTKVILDV